MLLGIDAEGKPLRQVTRRLAVRPKCWTGLAIGRSIWWHPLRAHLRHTNTAREDRRRIKDAYLDYARFYLRAREGMLPAEPDPML